MLSLPIAIFSIQGGIISSRHLMQASMLSLRPCKKMNGGITSSLLVTTSNTMWTEYLVFIDIGSSYGERANGCSMILPEIFLICEKLKHIHLEAWVCWLVLQCSFSSCPSWFVIKIGSLSTCMKNAKFFLLLFPF